MIRRLAIAACFLVASVAHAAPGAARERLDTFAKGLHSLSGNFSQEGQEIRSFLFLNPNFS